MGAGASVTQEDVKSMPQYTILGGDAKFAELKDEEGKVDLAKITDPYLKYGGSYGGDLKDTKDFKYLTFSELPKFTAEHKSLMAKTLTPELFESLKDKKIRERLHVIECNYDWSCDASFGCRRNSWR